MAKKSKKPSKKAHGKAPKSLAERKAIGARLAAGKAAKAKGRKPAGKRAANPSPENPVKSAARAPSPASAPVKTAAPAKAKKAKRGKAKAKAAASMPSMKIADLTSPPAGTKKAARRGGAKKAKKTAKSDASAPVIAALTSAVKVAETAAKTASAAASKSSKAAKNAETRAAAAEKKVETAVQSATKPKARKAKKPKAAKAAKSAAVGKAKKAKKPKAKKAATAASEGAAPKAKKAKKTAKSGAAKKPKAAKKAGKKSGSKAKKSAAKAKSAAPATTAAKSKKTSSKGKKTGKAKGGKSGSKAKGKKNGSKAKKSAAKPKAAASSKKASKAKKSTKKPASETTATKPKKASSKGKKTGKAKGKSAGGKGRKQMSLAEKFRAQKQIGLNARIASTSLTGTLRDRALPDRFGSKRLSPETRKQLGLRHVSREVSDVYFDRNTGKKQTLKKRSTYAKNPSGMSAADVAVFVTSALVAGAVTDLFSRGYATRAIAGKGANLKDASGNYITNAGGAYVDGAAGARTQVRASGANLAIGLGFAAVLAVAAVLVEKKVTGKKGATIARVLFGMATGSFLYTGQKVISQRIMPMLFKESADVNGVAQAPTYGDRFFYNEQLPIQTSTEALIASEDAGATVDWSTGAVTPITNNTTPGVAATAGRSGLLAGRAGVARMGRNVPSFLGAPKPFLGAPAKRMMVAKKPNAVGCGSAAGSCDGCASGTGCDGKHSHGAQDGQNGGVQGLPWWGTPLGGSAQPSNYTGVPVGALPPGMGYGARTPAYGSGSGLIPVSKMPNPPVLSLIPTPSIPAIAMAQAPTGGSATVDANGVIVAAQTPSPPAVIGGRLAAGNRRGARSPFGF